MQERIIVSKSHFNIILTRLAFTLIENHFPFQNSLIIGIQPRGVFFSEILASKIKSIKNLEKLNTGKIDITFHRDDFLNNEKVHLPNFTQLNGNIDGKNIILIDDVLYTGRTIRAAMDALLEYGRPARIELLTLVDRRYSRELPVQPNYTGIEVDSVNSEKVKVIWNYDKTEAEIWIIPKTQ